MSPTRSVEDHQKGSLYSSCDIWVAAMTGDFVASWMPSVFIPLAGVLGPAVVMVLMFNLIETTAD